MSQRTNFSSLLVCLTLGTFSASALGNTVDIALNVVGPNPAEVGELVRIDVVLSSSKPVPQDFDALGAIVMWDPTKLKLLDNDQAFDSAGGPYFAGFFPDADGINELVEPSTPMDGDAFFQAFTFGQTFSAPVPPGEFIATSLIFEALAPTSGTDVKLVATMGDFGETGVALGGADVTGAIGGPVEVVILPLGACCFTEGACTVLAADECFEAGGTYQGDDTDCESDLTCVGACCTADGCVIVTEDECDASAGFFYGFGTSCPDCDDANPCTDDSCNPRSGECVNAPNDCPPCDVEVLTIECEPGENPEDPDFYNLSLLITNNSGVTVQYILLPGDATSPNIVTLDEPLPNFETTKIEISINGPQPGEFCFFVVLADQNVNDCCSVQVCVNLRDCDGVCSNATGECCTNHGGLGCNQPACCESVCAADPFCCDVAWDSICAGEAQADPNCDCPSVCDTATNDCCAAGGGPGCNQPACCESVCAIDPFCCDAAWDGLCASEAQADPNCDCVCQNATGDCCIAHGGLGCTQPACCDSVCAADPFCCDTAWDGICADEAQADPNCNCNNDICERRIDLGGGEVLDFAFSTVGATTDGPAHPGLCNFFGNPQISQDIWFNWTSDRTGDWVFSLCGSSYDSEIAVYNGCECPVGDANLLACNDDFCGLQSEVTVSAIEGQCYKVRIGGFGSSTGNGVLNITQESGGPCDGATGDCCTNHGGLGCNQPACCQAICAADPFCCDVAWDSICADAALTNPNCDCGKACNCCAPTGGPGCDDPDCEATVCAVDPFCCDVSWDSICAGEGEDLCDCCDGDDASNCCVANGGLGCSDPDCEAAVCAIDPFCCDVAWDGICAGEAAGFAECGCAARSKRKTSCPADLTDDVVVNGADLGLLLSNWGTQGLGDFDGSGAVDGSDLGLLLFAWGTCP